jgi:Flp pilus assembly protein TadG
MRNLTVTNVPVYRQRLRPGGDRGTSLVEVALVLPVLLLLLVGAAEFGFLCYQAIEVSNAASAGVQYGARDLNTANDAPGMRLAALNDGADVSSLVATPSHFCKCSDGTASTCAPTDCSGIRIVEYVQVNTSATVSPSVALPGLPRAFTLTGRAIMRVQK